ncbi:VRR-NUC domain-containing protein (plasmid) [Nocardia sp. NBC_01503]|uniref:VRR-NUC domain-containing protein n=1 Tax=Nocardia sp. NBC_01503 TaxID=2975997 RepID=UPI002E7C4EFD|nr:VRR-NUC domain-containing protein [Nocardia sp. NBC_01503]WTL36696.1 VRR-NUC domain-containing protein [Nocardia sp. NBC_01503]WTL36751.1 VRR-NUC domain-containing protein [Nocardia sp. NBC_01503]
MTRFSAPPTVISEADFQRRVMDTAQRCGWIIVHTRPARTARGWVTPYEGDQGLPDLILARRGRVLLVELKSDKGRATAAQLRWLQEAGPNGRLWRPRHQGCASG